MSASGADLVPATLPPRPRIALVAGEVRRLFEALEPALGISRVA